MEEVVDHVDVEHKPFVFDGRMQRIASLTILFVIFEMVSYITSWHMPELPFYKWLELALAGSYMGRCIAYMVIGEPFRFLFTKVVKHSAGTGESVDPKWSEGWMAGLSILIACPICSGAWSTLAILFLLTYIPHLGETMLVLFAAAGLGWLITRITEAVEWLGRYLWEITGHWNALNKERTEGIHESNSDPR